MIKNETASGIISEMRILLNRLADTICDERSRACNAAYKGGVRDAERKNAAAYRRGYEDGVKAGGAE